MLRRSVISNVTINGKGAGRLETTMRLRQICLVVEDISAAEDALTQIFGLAVGERAAGVGKFGLDNFLIPIGGDFLEVVAPTRDGTAAGRFLERRKGDGGYMAIFQCDDGLAYRERITSRGVRLIWSRSDRDDYTPSQYHPRDCHGTILAVGSVDGGDRRDEMGDWPPARDHWRAHVRRDITQSLAGAEMQTGNPKVSAELWSDLLATPLRTIGPDAYALSFDNAEMRFVEAIDGRGDGLGGIDLRVGDKAHVRREAAARGIPVADGRLVVCGMRVRLV